MSQAHAERVSFWIKLFSLSFLSSLPPTSLSDKKQLSTKADTVGCSKLCTQLRCGHKKLGDPGAGCVGASMWRLVCSWLDAVTYGHIVFWLHQPKAVPAEVKLRDLHVGVDQLQVKVRQHKEHESAER